MIKKSIPEVELGGKAGNMERSGTDESNAPSRQREARHPKQSVLVIEDNRDMRDFLRLVLVRRGFVLLEAADGAEGIAIARSERPDLILMDLSLPHMDGLEATRKLKADPDLSHIPIIAVTARARSSDQVAAREAGCDGYISKPYSLQEFLDILKVYLPAD